MKKRLAIICASILFIALPHLAAADDAGKEAEQKTDQKVVALGDVDIGQNNSGQKAYEIKETIQLGLKKQLEKKGKGSYSIKIVSPTTMAKGSQPEIPNMPDIPEDRPPTQKEMAQLMAAMQQMQKQMSGQVRVYSPVDADAFFDFRIVSGTSGADTSGTASTIADMTGLNTSAGDVGMRTTKVYLIATMRSPKDGAPIDQYTAKATSVKFRNLAGYTDYNYGSDEMTRERLFSSAIKECAKWINSKIE